MSYLDKYKNKEFKGGRTLRERLKNEEIKTFNIYLENAPTGHYVKRKSYYYPEKTMLCTIQDSAFNDFRANDSKVVCVRHDEEVVVGDSFEWRGRELLCIYEEENSVEAHRTMIFKICNNFVTLKDGDGIIKLPCILSDATLYSDGLYRGQQFITNNDKRALVVSYNDYTKNIDAFQRLIFNGDSAYKISKIDNYSSVYLGANYGVLQLMLIRDDLLPEDDLENNIAYNPMSTIIKTKDIVDIIGVDRIKIGESAEFSLTGIGVNNKVYLKDETYATIGEFKDGKCVLTAKKQGFAELVFECGLNTIEKKIMIIK